MKKNTRHLVIMGCGIAGLSAALSVVETLIEEGQEDVQVTILERADKGMRGGSSRWTGAYLRVTDESSVYDGFIDDMVRFSGGYSDQEIIKRLADDTPDTLAWLKRQGIAFENLSTIFLTARHPRLLPVGGGKAVVETLAAKLESYGVSIQYNTVAQRLILREGTVLGVEVRRHGKTYIIDAHAVILASGGFEGNPEMLSRYIGQHAYSLHNISPGGVFNKGEGIEMALSAGAKSSGDFSSFHAEPIDPRSRMPEAVVMLFPYGVVVNKVGQRFIDEGKDTIDEIYEQVSRMILGQPEQIAYCICDQRIYDIENYHRALGTDQEPFMASSIAELAEKLQVPVDSLTETIANFNDATRANTLKDFVPDKKDGLHTLGLTIPKSNWAFPLDRPPYLAWPLICSIVFTFGGVAINTEAQIIDRDEYPVSGLYAAGEITGLYYGKYPGATSFLRGAVFGRIAGKNAARFVMAES